MCSMLWLGLTHSSCVVYVFTFCVIFCGLRFSYILITVICMQLVYVLHMHSLRLALQCCAYSSSYISLVSRSLKVKGGSGRYWTTFLYLYERLVTERDWFTGQLSHPYWAYLYIYNHQSPFLFWVGFQQHLRTSLSSAIQFSFWNQLCYNQ